MKRVVPLIMVIWNITAILGLISIGLSVKNYFSRYDPRSRDFVPRIYLMLPKGTGLSLTPFGTPVYFTQMPGVWEQYNGVFDTWGNQELGWRSGTAPAASYKVCPVAVFGGDLEFIANQIPPGGAPEYWKPCYFLTNFQGRAYSGQAARTLLEAAGLLRLVLLFLKYLGSSWNKDEHPQPKARPSFSS